MLQRELGKSGLRVSAVGLGCMGMSEFYDPKQKDDEESVRVIHQYLDAGGNLVDTADMYGVGQNEELVGAGTGSFFSSPSPVMDAGRLGEMGDQGD